MPNFTKTQQKILDVLSDGQRHHKTELVKILPDQEGEDMVKTVSVHLVYLRKKLRPIGQDIICEFYQRRTYYRHIRMLLVRE